MQFSVSQHQGRDQVSRVLSGRKLPTQMAASSHRHIDHGPELDTRETAAGRGIEVYNFGHHLQPVPLPTNHSTLPEASQSWSGDTRQGCPLPYTKDQHEDPSPGLETSKTCGIPSKRFWVYVGFLVAAVVVALGVGLGTHFGLNHSSSTAKSFSSATVNNMSIAAVHWLDVDNVSQYRVFFQAKNQSKVLQSASNSDDKNWTVSTITTANTDVRTGTPLSAVAGYLNTNLNYLVRRVTTQPSKVERACPPPDTLRPAARARILHIYIGCCHPTRLPRRKYPLDRSSHWSHIYDHQRFVTLYIPISRPGRPT